MTEIIRIAGVGFMGGMLALTVKKDRPEFALMISLVCAVMISFEVIKGVGDVMAQIDRIITQCGVDIKYLEVSLKAVGIAYVSQFSAEILRDGGETAIASKVEMAGKVAILVITIPVLGNLLEMCIKVVQGV